MILIDTVVRTDKYVIRVLFMIQKPKIISHPLNGRASLLNALAKIRSGTMPIYVGSSKEKEPDDKTHYDGQFVNRTRFRIGGLELG